MTEFLVLYSAHIILPMAAGNFVFLFLRAYQRRDWSIFAVSLTRLYFVGLYLWVIIGSPTPEERLLPGRWAVIFLMGVELLNHLIVRRNHACNR